jgi:TPR repeat protein
MQKETEASKGKEAGPRTPLQNDNSRQDRGAIEIPAVQIEATDASLAAEHADSRRTLVPADQTSSKEDTANLEKLWRLLAVIGRTVVVLLLAFSPLTGRGRASVSESQPSESLLASRAAWLAEARRDLQAKDYAKAIPLLQQAANADDADAMMNLGVLYENGWGVTQDYVKAREWYQKAATAGNAEAMNNLGALYDKGRGVAQDYAQARRWYQKAATAGNPNAMNNLGELYHYSRGVAQDYVKAREWYQKAAAAGNAEAMNNLGVVYENEGVVRDYAQAREWYQKAAAAGNTAAMNNLGLLYYYGRGVAQDHAKAHEWFQKAGIAVAEVPEPYGSLRSSRGPGESMMSGSRPLFRESERAGAIWRSPRRTALKDRHNVAAAWENTPAPRTKAMASAMATDTPMNFDARNPLDKLPTFFPPRATDRFSIPLRLIGENVTLQQLADRLDKALQEAGYEGRCSYYWLDDEHGPGFAIITHIERIQPDGKPVLDQRWGLDLPHYGQLTLGSLLKAVMHADPGRYRLIALVACRQPLVEKDTPMTPDQVVTLNKGPSWLGDSPWKTVVATADFHLIAYVYEFERPSRSDKPVLRASSNLSAEQHLRSTGLYEDIEAECSR